jgi:hypothetical protein
MYGEAPALFPAPAASAVQKDGTIPAHLCVRVRSFRGFVGIDGAIAVLLILTLVAVFLAGAEYGAERPRAESLRLADKCLAVADEAVDSLHLCAAHLEAALRRNEACACWMPPTTETHQ